ncbi:MAG: trypsin-like peptidase domain-containing protein [Pirellula sp.]|jgi:serine/threonine protein kinase|nr:trypsin-like peptidase domain-containing protein [Pirellula sp.]
MNSSNRCLEAAQVELLLQGNLSPEEYNSAQEHFEACENCRRRVEATIGPEQWWADVQNVLLHSKHDILSTSHVADEETPSSPNAKLLELLGPTDDPNMLGRIGSYEIVGLLGQGGMGAVFKAFDAPLNRFVAIKMLLPHLAASGAARKRFAREAQAVAAVVDDHVMAIHCVDEWQGVPYLVMTYSRGITLQKRLSDNGPLEVREILRIGMQAAKGLAAAHAQGIVHRDIKPANIFLDQTVERVQLMDFGLARAADDASLTRTGVLAGTPQYMSPEQARAESVDHRSDLFSLGSVMYAMCTGHAPFRAESSYSVLRLITDKEPRPIREVNPDVPQWLCGVICKLMAKQAHSRFESASSVADLLESCLAHVQQPTAVTLPQGVYFMSTTQNETSETINSEDSQNRVRRWLVPFFLTGLLITCSVAVALREFALRSERPNGSLISATPSQPLQPAADDSQSSTTLPEMTWQDIRNADATTVEPPNIEPAVTTPALDCESVYSAVQKAVVRINGDNKQFNGTLVTPEGHILVSPPSSSGRIAPIQVTLSDGRRFDAVQLGWSNEWSIGLLKITDESPFPYVRMSDVADPGTHCLSVGFPFQYDYQPYEPLVDFGVSEPIVHFGHIETVVEGNWFTAKIPFFSNSGTGIFDSQGRLTGVSPGMQAMDCEPFITSCRVVRDLWGELTKRDHCLEVTRFRDAIAKMDLKTLDTDLSAEDAAFAATVRIKRMVENGGWSGTLISRDGLIATCAHSGQLPGEKVKVELADGRDVIATVIWSNPISDVSMIRIDEGEDWPHVKCGDSTITTVDTEVTRLGFPGNHQGRRGLRRTAKIAPSIPSMGDKKIIPSVVIRWESDDEVIGGESGGGLFNAQGQLIGMTEGGTSSSRIEAIAAQWNSKSLPAIVRKRETAEQPHDPWVRFENSITTARPSVVEIFSNKKRCCLGTVVSSDGQIVTKASELNGELTCRLLNGDEHSVTILRVSREDDLALVKIDTRNLVAIPIADSSPSKYDFVAAVLPDKPRRHWYNFEKAKPFGIVTQNAKRVNGWPGHLGAFNNADDGIKLYSTHLSPEALKKGDVLLSINGQRITNLDRFNQIMKPSDGKVIGFPGDPVQLEIRRGEQKMNLAVNLSRRPTALRQSSQPTSARDSGFADAFDCDLSLYPIECGAPIINDQGRALGIAIAVRGDGYLYVVSNEALRQFLNSGKSE